MPRKGENIYKRKDGRWEGRYIKNRSSSGKALYGYVYATSYKAVKDKLQNARYAAFSEAEPLVPVASKTNVESAAFSEVADSWLSMMRPQIKESSYVKYRNLIFTYIIPHFGAIQLNQLTNNELDVFCKELLTAGGKSGTGLSAKTVADVLSVIRSILRYADRKELYPASDGKGVSVKQEGRILRVLSVQDQMVLQNYLINHLSDKNLGVLLCLFTGLRIGEICALKWEDILFEEGAIYVHSTMQRLQTEGDSKRKTKVIISTPKSTCSIRKIPVPEELIKLLEMQTAEHCGFVLTGSKQKFIEPRTMENHFKKVLSECNLEKVNFHTLRHTFATRCIELGFDVKSLSEILGHASIAITMNRYVHPSMKLKRENMQRLSCLFSVK